MEIYFELVLFLRIHLVYLMHVTIRNSYLTEIYFSYNSSLSCFIFDSSWLRAVPCCSNTLHFVVTSVSCLFRYSLSCFKSANDCLHDCICRVMNALLSLFMCTFYVSLCVWMLFKQFLVIFVFNWESGGILRDSKLDYATRIYEPASVAQLMLERYPLCQKLRGRRK